MSEASLYRGWVMHDRPGAHRLRYRIFMLALDLDDLAGLGRALRLFAHNRISLVSFFDRDHGDGGGASLKDMIGARLREAGIDWTGGRIVIVSMPRIFNYVFNPLSVYLCTRADGSLAGLVYEVSNTFGERHFYTLPPAIGPDGRISQGCDKRFFVSPFLPMDLRYEFEITPPGAAFAIAMRVWRGSSLVLTASFAGEQRPLDDANLLRAWAADPLMSLKVIAGIHWEALQMWAKGIGFLGRGKKHAME